MGFVELFLTAAALSMDAFAVAICKGLALDRADAKSAAVVGLYFGGFQALMPLLGYLAGVRFATSIEAFDHWLAFILLAFIGGRMVIGSLKKDDDAPQTEDAAPLCAKAILPLAIATSIDALAVGVSFAFLRVEILPAVALIGLITFLFSFAGVRLGRMVGASFRSKAELVGGVVLVLIGVKILLEHIGILRF